MIAQRAVGSVTKRVKPGNLAKHVFLSAGDSDSYGSKPSGLGDVHHGIPWWLGRLNGTAITAEHGPEMSKTVVVRHIQSI